MGTKISDIPPAAPDLENMPEGSSLGDFIRAGMEGEPLSHAMEWKIKAIAAAWGERRVRYALTHTPVQTQIDLLQARIKELEERL